MSIHPVLAAVTERIAERSAPERPCEARVNRRRSTASNVDGCSRRAVAAAAAARPRSTVASLKTQGARAQTRETPAIAEGGSSLCKGGEWR